MNQEELRTVAEYYWELFDRYSVNPPIDRLDPAFRVGFSDLSAKFPKLHMLDRIELDSQIKQVGKERRRKCIT